MRRRKVYVFLFSLMMLIESLIFSGCMQQEQTESTEVSVFYHADDGEYNPVHIFVTPKYTLESAKESGKTIISCVVTYPIGEQCPYEEIADLFNNLNEKYYVDVEVVPFGAELGSARTRIAIDVAAGRGPDVIMADMFDVTENCLDMGVFVDMTALLEESNIDLEYYFPGYASITKDGKIYGVCPDILAKGLMVYENVIDSAECPTLDKLLDCLLNYNEKAAFVYGNERGEVIVNYFLEGSSDLCGIIDWENKRCDFSSPLFEKLLKVGKKYCKVGTGLNNSVMDFFPITYDEMSVSDISGKIFIGNYFDDGCFPWYQARDSLLINSNTVNLEGAYAFISFVMSQYGQNYVSNPVNRATWEEKARYQMSLIEKGRAPGLVLNEDIIQQYIDFYDNARYLPRNTEMILDIVYEESGAYFAGDKSLENVIDIIQTRVQLYLNEQY